jgi:hypothetical protein
MEKKILYIVLLVTLSFNALSLFKLSQVKSNSSEMYKSIEYLKNENEISNQELFTYLKNEGLEINKDMKLVSRTNEVCVLSDIIKSNKYFVFVFSEKNCNECNRDLINNFNKLCLDIGSEKVLFFGDFSDQKNLSNFIIENDINCRAFLFNYQKPNLFKNVETPFFFILDNNFNTKLFFKPNKKLNHIKTYLDIIKNKFVENNKTTRTP